MSQTYGSPEFSKYETEVRPAMMPEKMTIETAVRIVAKFDRYEWSNFAAQYADRNAIISAALKLPRVNRRQWAERVYQALGCAVYSFASDKWASLICAPTEPLLIALAETIQQMEQEKGKE